MLLVMTNRLFAQAGATGTILGTVTDSSGAIIPNVKVTVTNTATNAILRLVTSSSGDYSATSLPPGTYTVSAEAKSFEKTLTSAFQLAVDEKRRVDLALKPGSVTETLEVTTQAVTLDTDSSDQSTLLSQQQVEQLPLNGRNFMQLLLVSAGAVTVGGEQGTMRQGEGNAVSINGGRPEGNNYTLDGLVNTDQALQTPAVILSQDAIQEFKVESGTYPAEYGFAASQVNIVSKSGGNNLHGALFESNRNQAYDALPFCSRTNSVLLWTAQCIFPNFITAATDHSSWPTGSTGSSTMAISFQLRFQTPRLLREIFPRKPTRRNPMPRTAPAIRILFRAVHYLPTAMRLEIAPCS
jgi:hypothetical protein